MTADPLNDAAGRFVASGEQGEHVLMALIVLLTSFRPPRVLRFNARRAAKLHPLLQRNRRPLARVPIAALSSAQRVPA